MQLSQLFTRRRAVRAFVTVAMAFPLLGASDCGITGLDEDDSAKYDGVYNLVSVDGQSLSSGYNLVYVDSRNKLVLTKGVWTLSGKSLSTAMYTTSTINGSSTSSIERHSGTVAR